jgi:AraC family transcriptional regulator
MKMSFSGNTTSELWRGFMPRLKEISNKTDSSLYSVEIYSEGFFDSFDPDVVFEKWAAAEVSEFAGIPEKMTSLVIPEGTYAVFIYRGLPAEAEGFYRYIFNEWLPSSGYSLDNRPHFAKMGGKYRSNDPASEEEIWIPVKMSV